MHHYRGQRRQKLNQIVSVRHGIHAVARHPIEAHKGSRIFSVQGIGGPCQSPRAQRTIIHPSFNVSHTLPVTPEHFKVRAVVMRQRSGLGLLEVGEAGHIGLQIFFHDRENYHKQFL